MQAVSASILAACPPFLLPFTLIRMFPVKSKISVIVWNEFEHERQNAAVRAIYPDGIHAVIADALRRTPGLNPGALPLEVGTATLDQPEHGLSEERLAGCDGGV